MKTSSQRMEPRMTMALSRSRGESNRAAMSSPTLSPYHLRGFLRCHLELLGSGENLSCEVDDITSALLHLGVSVPDPGHGCICGGSPLAAALIQKNPPEGGYHFRHGRAPARASVPRRERSRFPPLRWRW